MLAAFKKTHYLCTIKIQRNQSSPRRITVSADTMNEEYDNVFVCFHIGRGGRYGNPGHKEYLPYVRDFQNLLNRESENLYDVTEDENGNVLPDDQWRTLDDAGETVIEGREAMEAKTGKLDYDGKSDTYIVKNINNCDEDELQLIIDADEQGEYVDSDVLAYALNELGQKDVTSVEADSSSMDIYYNECGHDHLNKDEFLAENGEDEDYIRSILRNDMGYLERSAEDILCEMRCNGWIEL